MLHVLHAVFFILYLRYVYDVALKSPRALKTKGKELDLKNDTI